MANVLSRTIRTRIPQRDGRFYAEIEFTVENETTPLYVRATMLEADTDVDVWADGYEAKLDSYLKENEWNTAAAEAVEQGLNPLRAERVYKYNTKLEIAQRLKDKTDAKVIQIESMLSKWQLLQNKINTFLGTV